MIVLAQTDFGASLREALTNIAEFIPLFLGFLAILIIGYFIAKLIAKAVDKVLERVGFDRAVERGGVRKAMEHTKYDANALMGQVVFYTLMLFVLQLAFGIFGPNPISDLINGVIAYLPNIFVAILIIVITAAVAAAIREIVQASLGGLSYGRALATIASVAILVIGVFAALNQLQIAEPIVNGLFYAGLAVIAGSAIIAIGGGGIVPMRAQWEKALNRVEEEAPRIKEEAQGSKEDIRERAEIRKQQYEDADSSDDRSDAGRAGREYPADASDVAAETGTRGQQVPPAPAGSQDRTVQMPDEADTRPRQ